MRILLPLSLLTACLLGLSVPPTDAGDAESPLSSLSRLDLEVQHWEGTFGTYLVPQRGDRVVLDVDRIGKEGLVSLHAGEGRTGSFDLDHLATEHDTTEGDAAAGWTRRVVLVGRRDATDTNQTVLELVMRYEVTRFEDRDGRRVQLSGNRTHATLRIHTLRDDETLREYALATLFHDRDSGLRIPGSGSEAAAVDGPAKLDATRDPARHDPGATLIDALSYFENGRRLCTSIWRVHLAPPSTRLDLLAANSAGPHGSPWPRAAIVILQSDQGAATYGGTTLGLIYEESQWPPIYGPPPDKYKLSRVSAASGGNTVVVVRLRSWEGRQDAVIYPTRVGPWGQAGTPSLPDSFGQAVAWPEEAEPTASFDLKRLGPSRLGSRMFLDLSAAPLGTGLLVSVWDGHAWEGLTWSSPAGDWKRLGPEVK